MRLTNMDCMGLSCSGRIMLTRTCAWQISAAGGQVQRASPFQVRSCWYVHDLDKYRLQVVRCSVSLLFNPRPLKKTKMTNEAGECSPWRLFVCLALSCVCRSCFVLRRLVLPGLVVSCLVASCRFFVASGLVLSCPGLPRFALCVFCLALCCLIFLFWSTSKLRLACAAKVYVTIVFLKELLKLIFVKAWFWR